MKKKVLILGASSDIGIEIIKIYLKNNFDVIAHYNNGNNKFFSFIKKEKIKKIKFNFLTNFKKIDTFSKKKIFTNCSVLINSLAMIKERDYEKINSMDIIDSFKVNLLPGIIFTKNLGLIMNKNGWGRIVNLGSIGIKFGGGLSNFPYSIAKFALEFFPSKTKKWIQNNVFINTIRVGVTNTKLHKKLRNKNLKTRVSQIPIKRIAKPEEIAKLVYFLGSKENTYIANDIVSISGGE